MMSWLPSRSANLVDNGDTLDQPRNPKPGTALAARWKRRDILKSADAAIKPSTSYRRQAAMTLIELLITVAVLGILAAIAVPSYLEYVRQARRADAESILMKAVQFLERTYTTRNCYNWGGGRMRRRRRRCHGIAGGRYQSRAEWRGRCGSLLRHNGLCGHSEHIHPPGCARGGHDRGRLRQFDPDQHGGQGRRRHPKEMLETVISGKCRVISMAALSGRLGTTTIPHSFGNSAIRLKTASDAF